MNPDTQNNKTAHGGKRKGAGRKPTGRKRQILWITEEELVKVKDLIKEIRTAN